MQEQGVPLAVRVAFQGETELLKERQPPLGDVLVPGRPLGIVVQCPAGDADPGTFRHRVEFERVPAVHGEAGVVRGFLFEAFRGSYSFLVSTILVLGFQIYFHWRLIINDWLAGTLFILTAVLLCTMRERTRSLWNCFLLHSGYNATIIRQWPLWLAIVGVLLAVRLGSVKQPNLMEETKV